MAERSLSKKELQQPDAIEQWLYKTANVLYAKRNLLIIIILCILLIVIGTFAWSHYQEIERAERSHLFHQAQKTILVNPDQPYPAIESLQQFIQRHPDGLESAIALLQLGELYVLIKNWFQAEEVFQKVLNHPKIPEHLKQNARISLVSIYENQKRWEQARKVASQIQGPGWDDLRLQIQARIAIATNQVEEARKHWQVLEKTANTPAIKEEAALSLWLYPLAKDH